MIIHADMDAFYASVEIRERPSLADKPVAVGGSAEGRGVIAAANYIARQYGVHSAMPTITAKRLCPDLILIRGRMNVYAEVSDQIHAIFQNYTPLIEPLSLDEAFLDVTASEKLFGSAQEIGRAIKRDVREQLKLVVSIGIAPNKFVAKIASDIDKPDGFVYVPRDQVQAFLDPLPIKRIWGVGKVTERTLKQKGIETIKDLRSLPQNILHDNFGEHGLHLWRLSHGIDERKVVTDHVAKSISHETTFAQDIDERDQLLAILLQLTEQVGARLRRAQLQGRTVHIKVRYADFETVTRARTLPDPTNITSQLWHAARALFDSRLPKPLPPVRLLGMGVSGFESDVPRQHDLFADENSKMAKVDTVADSINTKFGGATVQRGAAIKRK
jgi:DNA polymerase-4